MGNFKMLVQYDGARYNGWQKQGNTANTIQEKLEKVLMAMAGAPVEVIGSGRTDAGAHAKGQVANFHLQGDWQAEKITSYLNQYLPKDIGIVSVCPVEERFHARHHATGKMYCYRCRVDTVPNVFERNYYFDYQRPLSISHMKQGASYLVGKHDFKAFCANKRYKKSTVRTLYSIDIVEQNGEVFFYFCGSGFLYNMVRILVGTLMDVGEGKIQPEKLLDILHSKKRENAGITVPACGLTLLTVYYEPIDLQKE